ncbi:MAG: redoxin family protein [Hyphomicrobiales bacterium]|nr:redoxin family protein [Hyphomicrobiales bacterium]
MFNPESPPELEVTRWLNTDQPLSLARLKGRVVVLVAFQMLCPGCVEHGLPQAKRIAARFRPQEVAVIGLHTVFEHHDVMTPAALEVFLGEYRWPFPVAIDAPDGDGVPKSMAAYQMQGTPSLLIFDRAGRLRRHYFGRPDDMLVAAEIAAMALEDGDAPRAQAASTEQRMARALAPAAHSHDHGHDHDDHAHEHGDACGCGHDHDHDHAHDHGHAHGHDQPSPPRR